MCLSSAGSRSGWSCVALLNLYLIHVHVVYTEAGQSFMAVSRIKPASNGGVLLCANCTRVVESPKSKQTKDSVDEIKGYKPL